MSFVRYLEPNRRRKTLDSRKVPAICLTCEAVFTTGNDVAPEGTAAADFAPMNGKGQEEHQPQKVTFGGEGSEIGQFENPCGVTVSDEGEIFVTDSDKQRIQVFIPQGMFVRQFPTVVSDGNRGGCWKLVTEYNGYNRDGLPQLKDWPH
ncbi:hypothetical protein Bbelb_248930 [Branchiostoma belcheri]|nr:hypothetical protein Bbelb_248930 [Branchiostoma belcheri]